MLAGVALFPGRQEELKVESLYTIKTAAKLIAKCSERRGLTTSRSRLHSRLASGERPYKRTLPRCPRHGVSGQDREGKVSIMVMPATDEWDRYVKDRDDAMAIAQQEQRLRRLLRKRQLFLRKSRGERQKNIFGDYYITDAAGIMPILRNVSLEWVEEQVAARPWRF
jgi:hypothetical protein